MYKMKVCKDIPCLILYCPYLDSANHFALLLWSDNPNPPTYNVFLSAFQLWPCSKIIELLLDPISQFDARTIKSHADSATNVIKFSQDFLYSANREWNWPAPPSIHRGLEWPQCLNHLLVYLFVCLIAWLFSVCKFSHFSSPHPPLCSTVSSLIYL